MGNKWKKRRPTILVNSSIRINENRMWFSAVPNFERMFFPSFGSTPSLPQADFAHKIAWKIV